ncbi:hypothetical protein ABVT39_016551 [Epinephelus coioides]
MVMLELQKMSGGEADKQEDLGEPPAIKLCKAQAGSSLDSVFDEIADGQESTSLSSAPLSAAIQLETNLGDTTIARQDNPLQYLGVKKSAVSHSRSNVTQIPFSAMQQCGQ